MSLSSVQKLHYLVSALKGEARDLIVNLAMTHENFIVAWNLVTERYNNSKLIAMTYVSQLFKLPQTKKNDAASLRQLINNVTKSISAIEALALKTPMQTLIVNHLLLGAIDSETHKSWELFSSTQEDVPSTTQVIKFLEQRCQALELLEVSQLTSTAAASNKGTSPSRSKVSHPARTYVTNYIQCALCKDSHRLIHCEQYIRWSPDKRMEFVHKARLCFNCLNVYSKDHTCSVHTCKQCGRRHHTSLHGATNNQAASDGSRTLSKSVNNRNSPSAETATYCSFKGKPTNQVLLATAIVYIQAKSRQYVPCRALLDSASQVSFISESCVKRLGLVKRQANTSIQGVNEINTTTQHSVTIQLRSKHSRWHKTITCAVLPCISQSTPTTKFNVSLWKLPTNLHFADEHFNTPGPVDLLLGAEVFYELLLPDRKIRHGYPTLQETVLGWIVSGTTPAASTSTSRQQSFLVQDVNLDLKLNRFWDIEPEQVELTSMTCEQALCERHFVTHTIQQSDGRFVVRLPFKIEPTELGTSRRMAENRLLAIERRLEKNCELNTQYHQFMQDYEAAGHMEPVQPQTGTDVCYFLPHHPVFKATSTTTKTRVVFDGGAQTSTGLSLNDILQVGPTIQDDLYTLVLRFRTHQVCFTADIAQMYRQINIHPQDRNLQRILWRYSTDDPIQEYQLKTVTYGTASAPFLATRCLKKLAEDNLTSHPKAAQVLRSDFYVDDLLSGTSTVQEAIDISQDLSSLLASAGFPLRKWASNNSQFLAIIPTELQETSHTISLDNEDGIPTLGLQWNPSSDQLQVRNVKLSSQSNSSVSTKRTVLSTTASIFDPLGLLSPTVIKYKMFIQVLWQHKQDWDTQLPASLQERWNQLLQTIPQLFHLKIPRKVICADAINIQIHGFCDASELAYGACLYVRSTDQQNQTSCELLVSTSRVTPLKQLTIPRLELCAAVLLAKLYQRATRALKWTVHESYLWTDSSIVLTWIHDVSTRWKTFVSNRVSFIQETTSNATWRHVPSASNPADLISRGIDPISLSQSALWWHGPGWLQHEASNWPSTNFQIATDNLEVKKTLTTFSEPREDIIERFSKIIRLKRVLAWCRRFAYNCKQSPATRRTATLTTQELHDALMCCIKLVQQTCYARELNDLVNQQEVSSNSDLKALHPFTDHEGILRVGGRLQNSTFPYHSIHQIILPHNCHFTKIVVLSEHNRLLHAGPQLLIATLRETYWIPRIRNLVKTVIHQCLPCYRHKVQASQQLMSQLPSSRVQPSRPFTITGIDYAGPVTIRLGPPRSKQTSKGYVAIFVCFSTKAIHIELVTSLSTDAFLAALRRFTARRGKPQTIFSDNGTNFQGAAHQLRAVYSMLHSSQMAAVKDHLTSEGTTWKFIPPHGPHHGGLWEAAVKSLKHHLRRALGTTIASYEELVTLLTEIEACLNSRPLCTLSTDPHSSTYLTPGHFLIGAPLVQLPSVDITEVQLNRLTRWQQFQKQSQTFWKHWSADYLHELQQRQKWQRSSSNLQLGQVVLLKDDNTPPLHWPTAIIKDVHPGADQKIRVVSVKTTTGVFKRPISKICPLPHVNIEL